VLYVKGIATELLILHWSADAEQYLEQERGKPDGQTTWEYLAMYVALLTCGVRFRTAGIAIAGDNLAALGGILNLKGKSTSLTKITREIAWKKTRFGSSAAGTYRPS